MKRNWRTLFAWFAALAIVSSCATPTPTPQPPATRASAPAGQVPTTKPGDWPMFRYSLDRAGYNPHEVTLRPPLELKWEFQAKSKI